MLKSWMHDASLALLARSGVTPALCAWLAAVTFAALMTVVFLCVAAYVWLELTFGGIFAGLIMAGAFLLLAIAAFFVSVQLRRHARERAMLERAARAHAPSWLLDPRVLATAVQIGREIGWQRIVPVAFLGFLAAQWAREHRGHQGAPD